MKKRIALILAGLVLGLTLALNKLALGESGGTTPYNTSAATTYLFDLQTAAFRSQISVVDSLTTSAILGTPAFNLRGARNGINCRKNLVVTYRALASADTCTIQPVYCSAFYNDDGTIKSETIKGYGPLVTLTAGTSLMESAYYVAPDFVFDTHGAATMHVLITTTSSVAGHQSTLWVGSF